MKIQVNVLEINRAPLKSNSVGPCQLHTFGTMGGWSNKRINRYRTMGLSGSCRASTCGMGFHGYDPHGTFQKSKNDILIAFSNHNLEFEPFIQVQITQSAN